MKKKVYIISPFKAEYLDINEAIRSAIQSLPNYEVINFESYYTTDVINGQKVAEDIAASDLIIAEISASYANVMYELGIAESNHKPIVSVAQRESSIPAFFANKYIIQLYDRKRLQETLVLPLIHALSSIEGKQIEGGFLQQKEKSKTVFVSYSHVDAAYLQRLQIHLKPFEKKGQIDVWSDTKIKAGEKWREIIQGALDRAAIAILLISADFLASDFIVDNELPPLLKAAEERGTLILPVILKPCRFTNHEHLSKFQAINNPKMPLSRMSEDEREEIYVNIADEIDTLLKR